MRLWRISAWPGITGEGGLYVDGRWHSMGRRVIYASEHPSLAMIEVMAHMRLSLTTIPITLKLIPVDIENGATRDSMPSLPSGWQANEATSQAVGNAWLTSGTALLLPVPSAIIAHSTNFIINPTHPDAGTHLREGTIEPFWFDKRFLR